MNIYALQKSSLEGLPFTIAGSRDLLGQRDLVRATDMSNWLIDWGLTVPSAQCMIIVKVQCALHMCYADSTIG